MGEPLFRIGVETDEAGRPRLLRLGARRIEVACVEDHWPGADHDYFRLRDGAGALYIVRYDHAARGWTLVLYEHAGKVRGGGAAR